MMVGGAGLLWCTPGLVAIEEEEEQCVGDLVEVEDGREEREPAHLQRHYHVRYN